MRGIIKPVIIFIIYNAMLIVVFQYICHGAPAMLQLVGHEGARNFALDPNCQGAWLMSSDAGEPDVSGNSADLTETGAANTTTNVAAGYSGYARYLSATGYLSHADGLSTDIYGADQSITFAAWVKMYSIVNDRYIICKGGTTAGSESYRFFIDNYSLNVYASLSSDGSATASAQSAATISTGQWYHIAVVYNDIDIRIYINGSLDSNGANNPLAYTGGINNASGGFGVGTCGSYTSAGDADDVIIFDRALSADEILEIYENGITGNRGGSD